MEAMTPANAFRLDGRVALVTGGAQGIGASIAEVLAAAGAAVLVTDINGEGAQTTAARIRAAGGRAEALRQDITDQLQWDAAINAAIDRLGGLDIMVNNAGIELVSLLCDTTLDQFRRVLQVNVEGTFLGITHAIRAMRPGGRAGRGGSIINMSSAAGLKPSFTMGTYGASKAAVRKLSDAAALECSTLGYGIRVNAVHPGLVDTRMGADTMKAVGELAVNKKIIEAMPRITVPLGMGQPKDIANIVLYLASDASRWVTATGVVVDGGLLAI